MPASERSTVEVSNAIVEVTIEGSRKVRKVRRMITDRALNPTNKPVVLSPELQASRSDGIELVGDNLVRSQEDLLDVLARLPSPR